MVFHSPRLAHEYKTRVEVTNIVHYNTTALSTPVKVFKVQAPDAENISPKNLFKVFEKNSNKFKNTKKWSLSYKHFCSHNKL